MFYASNFILCSKGTSVGTLSVTVGEHGLL